MNRWNDARDMYEMTSRALFIWFDAILSVTPGRADDEWRDLNTHGAYYFWVFTSEMRFKGP